MMQFLGKLIPELGTAAPAANFQGQNPLAWVGHTAVLKEMMPFEPTMILLYTLPKKQKLKGRVSSEDHMSSESVIIGVPPIKGNGVYGTEATE